MSAAACSSTSPMKRSVRCMFGGSTQRAPGMPLHMILSRAMMPSGRVIPTKSLSMAQPWARSGRGLRSRRYAVARGFGFLGVRHKFLGQGKHVLDDDLHALGIGMHLIGLIQRGHG